MKINIFSSGSKGNATLLSINNINILIDLGVSKKYLLSNLNKLDLKIEDVSFILLTHDHSDHICGLKSIDNIPIYGGEFTYKSSLYKVIKPYKEFTLFDVSILPIEVSHDARNPLGFLIKYKDESLVYITDTGYISNKNLKLIENATYYIIESNHNNKMLLETDRPKVLKERIMSEFGHMSNEDCALYLSTLIGERTKEIFLAHVSLEANTYDLALSTCISILKKKNIKLDNIKIKVAKQKELVTGGYED